MGFYLNKNMENIYISDSYFKNRILNNGKAPSISSMNETGNFLEKIGVEIPVISMSELLAPIEKFINISTMDKYSIILNFNKDHLLAILFLFYTGRITEEQLNDILFSSSAQSRVETFISFFDSQDEETVDIFAPLKSAVRKMSNKTNVLEKEKLSITNTKLSNSLKEIRYTDIIHTTSIGSLSYLIARGTDNNKYRVLQNIIKGETSIPTLSSEALMLLNSTSVPKITSLMNGYTSSSAFYWQSILYIAASNPAAGIIYALFGWMGNSIFNRILAAMSGTLMSLNFSSYYDFSFSGMGFKTWWSQNNAFKSTFFDRRYMRFGRVYINTLMNKAISCADEDYKKRLSDTATLSCQSIGNIDSEIIDNVRSDFCKPRLSEIFKQDDAITSGLFNHLVSTDSEHFSYKQENNQNSKTEFILNKASDESGEEISSDDIDFLNERIEPIINSTSSGFYLNNEFLSRFFVRTFDGIAKFTSSQSSLLELIINFNILINDDNKIINFGSFNLLDPISKIINEINKKYPVPLASENGQIGLIDIDNSITFRNVYGNKMINYLDTSIDNVCKINVMSNEERLKFIFAKHIVKMYLRDYICKDYIDESDTSTRITKDNLVDLTFKVTKYMKSFYKFLFYIRHMLFNTVEIDKIIKRSTYYSVLNNDLFGESAAIMRIYDFLLGFDNSWFLHWWAPNILSIKNDMHNMISWISLGSWW